MPVLDMNSIVGIEGEYLVYHDGGVRRTADLADCARRMAAAFPQAGLPERCVGVRGEGFGTLDLYTSDAWQERIHFYAPLVKGRLRPRLLRLRGIDPDERRHSLCRRTEELLSSAGWTTCEAADLHPEQDIPYGHMPEKRIPLERIVSVAEDMLTWMDADGVRQSIDLAACAANFCRVHPGCSGRCVGERWLATHFVLYADERIALVNEGAKGRRAYERFRQVQKMLSDAGWTTFDAT